MLDDEPQLARERVLMARPREERHESIPSWIAPTPLTMAKCQAHTAGCANLVPVYTRGMEAIESFSRILAERGEPPLDINACFPCSSCWPKRVAASNLRNTERRAKTAESIRYVKTAHLDDLNAAYDVATVRKQLPARAGDAVVKCVERLAWLSKVMGDGYVADLVNCLREKSRTGKTRPGRGDL